MTPFARASPRSRRGHNAEPSNSPRPDPRSRSLIASAATGCVAIGLVALLCLPFHSALADPPQLQATAPAVILVIGAPGEADYATNALDQVRRWEAAGAAAGQPPITLGLGTNTTLPDRQQLEEALAAQTRASDQPLWLVLIGHGTFDGTDARFNLRGPDVSQSELATWLQPFQRPLILVNTSAASAPFLNAISGTNRIVITATRSGNELNYAHFGRCFAEALADPESDLDQDGQTSLLETFLRATHRVAEFYKAEGRLATEHALIDDNGDHLGTPADWFRGLRATKAAKDGAALDGRRAHQTYLNPGLDERALTPDQRVLRDALEEDLERLRAAKAHTPEADYYRQLEAILLQLARIHSGTLPSPKSNPGLLTPSGR